jgi:signal peptidase I
MKHIISILILALCFNLSSFAQKKNDAIIAYADKQMGKKVDRGECWDLIAFALNDVKAEWKAPFDFGKEIKSNLIPGDIIRFENVKFEHEFGSMTFPDHYAIVYEVKDKDNIVIAHQNHNNKRVVQLLDIKLSDKKKGKMTFYRAK